jgi:nucleoside-diphosphate-sugar epimerase
VVTRVLVTGASGFIGRHVLTPLVQRGYEVHATRSTGRVPDAAPVGVTWHAVDLLDHSAATDLIARVRPTDLLHLAWYAAPGLFWTADVNDDWVRATSTLIDAVIAHGGKRIVGAGSCAEYDWSSGTCDELSTPLQPGTRYGAAKVAACRYLLDRGPRLTRGCAWGRVFFMYGPDEHPSRLVASIIRRVLAGEPAPCTEGSQRRDFLDVRDVAAGFVQLLDSSLTGAVNVSAGVAISVRELAERTAAIAGRPDLLRVGALQSRPDEPGLILGLPGRLHHSGWRPVVSLDRGLQESVSFWRGLQTRARG